MKPLLPLLLLAGCGTTSRTPYGKFVMETHSYHRGSSCLSDSHSHLYGPDGARMLEPLTRWQLSGNRRWALASGGGDARTLHLLDLDAGRLHSRHDLGMTSEEPGALPFDPLQWSSSRDQLLLECVESPRTRSLHLFTFEPELRVRTLFREEGVVASVHGLLQTFWAPDGTGLAFLVSPGSRAGPTRLFHAPFDGTPPRETDRKDGPPNTVAVDWDFKPPKLR